MKLTKAAAVDPNAELQAGMAKAVELQKAGKNAEARKIIEDLIAKYPEAYRLNAFVGSTYEAEKNYDKAIEHLKIVVDKEPADIDLKTYLIELYMLKGDKVEAQKLLDSVDMTQVKDPTLFINSAITLDQRREVRRGDCVAGQVDQAVPDAVATSSTTAPAPTSSPRRCPRRKPISKNSSRWRRLMRASCRMPKSFSNSSRTSSNASLVAACAVALALGACGGSGGSNGGGHHASAGRRHWLAGSLQRHGRRGPEDDRQEISGAQPLRAPASGALASRKAERVDGNPRGRLFDALWLNKSRADRIGRPTGLTAGRNAIDIGEIAVVQDEGDLIESPNAYDLRNLGLRFTRNGSGGYDVRRIDGGVPD